MMRTAALFLVLALAAPVIGMAAMIPRPEHPRPDLMRTSWQNLNGEWGFAFDPGDRGMKEKWFGKTELEGRIVVPFPVESELSGVHDVNPPDVLWCLRRFDLADSLGFSGGADQRLILHFGAVDYKAAVWLNGVKLGEHTGGYTPFSFDVTELVRPSGNVLVLRAWDSTDMMQARGKQTTKKKSYSILYTKVSGIWQTVWLEKTGNPYVKSFKFVSASDLSGGKFTLDIQGDASAVTPSIEITGPDGAREPYNAIRWDGMTANWHNGLTQPWSPDYPALYTVVITLTDREGEVKDRLESYVGIRTITVKDGEIRLNGKKLYQKLLLDQGYFPGGIYTAARDEAYKADLEMYRRMGFNGLRKHQKIEDPRFLYWCDKLGLLVWEEMPSLDLGVPKRVPQWAMDNFRDEWLAAIARDYNHPCIITWTVFNESWGIYQMVWSRRAGRWAKDVVRRTRSADPTRLVVDDSGGLHFDTDVWDFHHYLPTVEASRRIYQKFDFKPGQRLGLGWFMMSGLKGDAVLPLFAPGVRYEGQPVVLSEYGGFGFYKTEGDQSLLEKYRDYTLAIKDFPYIQGYCYTQPYDVEQEQNGLMTFDRTPKVDPDEIRKINDQMGQ